MSHKAVFLDKDGTLIEDIPYNVDPHRIVFATDAATTLQRLHQAGYLLVVITNQSGVARGYFPESALDAVEQRLADWFDSIGIALSGFYYCPHHPDGVVEPYAIACDCRKPGPGLLLGAAQELDIDLTQSWFIGDILNDVEAGRIAQCRTVLLDNGNETEWELSPTRLPHHIVPTLMEAANVILATPQSQVEPAPPSAPSPVSQSRTREPEPSLSHFIDRWQSLNVLVIGDVMLDSYFHGTVDRLCQEAPVPVVAVSERQDFPGGAANVAANVSQLGAKARLLSVIGQDEAGDRLQAALQHHHVSTTHLLCHSQRSTLAKQRLVGNAHLLVRFDQGSTDRLAIDLENEVIEQLTRLFSLCDAVIISDYGYGQITSSIIQTLEQLQSIHSKPIIIDSKQLKTYQNLNATAVKPNYQETIQLLNLANQKTDRVEQLRPYREQLLTLTGSALVAVTLDRDGVLLFDAHHPTLHLPTTPAPTHHTSGAGDTFISTLTLALAAHAPTTTAAQLALAATAIVVTQPGTMVCTALELRDALTKSYSP